MKVSFAGGLFSAIVGPSLGTLAFTVFGAIKDGSFSSLLAGKLYLLMALVMFGPAAFPAGFLTGYLSYRMAANSANSNRAVVVKSGACGAVLGAIAAAAIWLLVSGGRTDLRSVVVMGALGLAGGVVAGAMFGGLLLRAQGQFRPRGSAAFSA